MTAIERLLEVMEALRDPSQGCPWDQQQTHQSLIPYLTEETSEVIDAIESADPDHLREELGDLLFQIVFHARIAEENNHFDLDDVATGINDKLVRRHPHVFGGESFATDAEREAAWEKSKLEERRQKGLSNDHLLDGIPRSLPVLVRAEKLQNRAAHAGFDWPSTRPVIAKIHEELAEVCEAIEESHGQERIEEEIGDLLFVIANLARHTGVRADEALRKTNEKFIRRFRHVEDGIRSEGMKLEEASLEQMEAHWQAAKETEKSSD